MWHLGRVYVSNIHGSFTVVRAFGASQKDRARALPRFEAVAALDNFLRDSDRHKLVELAELIGSTRGYGRAGDFSTHELIGQVTESLERGTLFVLRGWDFGDIPRATAASLAPPKPEPAFPPTELLPEPETWFAVELVDETGEGVPGVELRFEVAGEARKATTGSDGRARVNGGRYRTAAVRLPRAEELRAKLDERWSKERTKLWREPPYRAVVFELTRTRDLPAIALEAESTIVVVLEPPYRVRLVDRDGKALGNLSCVAAFGGERRQLKTDGRGWVELLNVDGHEIAVFEWQEGKRTRSAVVSLECHDHHGDPSEVAILRLRNHGYPIDDDLERAVTLFQLDHGLELEPLAGGQIPQATIDRITQLWEDRHA
jgi:hypothetical protein